jgi:DNA-binding PadR family transcriptional regulator
VRLWPATLYGSLQDLLEYGWIEEAADPPGQQSERKRFYRVTRSGQTVARSETRRLAELVKIARSRVRPRGETA